MTTTTHRSRWSTQMLVIGAVCLAMSIVLSYFRFSIMPNGGGVTAASMVPLMLFAWMYGVGPGIIAGLAFSIFQYIQEPVPVHWLQIILDYPLAFASIGLAGCFRGAKGKWGLPAGAALACVLRFLCHTFAGLYFSEDPSANFMSKLIFSASYNATYMAFELIISVVITALPIVQQTALRLRDSSLAKG